LTSEYIQAKVEMAIMHMIPKERRKPTASLDGIGKEIVWTDEGGVWGGGCVVDGNVHTE